MGAARNSTMSPTPTQLQNQLSGLRRRGGTAGGESPVPTSNNNISRQGSRDSVSGGGRETPSFRSLQERYGTPTSPTEFVLIAGKTPLSDIDYQKSARHTLIGELASFGGVSQASKIAGPKRRPSQSPSMRLLGMLHVHDDPDDPVMESVANAQEYGGEKGRFMPPKRGLQAYPPAHPQAYPQAYPTEYSRSLSSQL